jgi:hypothetical protein
VPRALLPHRRLLLLTNYSDPNVAAGAAVLLRRSAPKSGVTAVEAVPVIVGMTAEAAASGTGG